MGNRSVKLEITCICNVDNEGIMKKIYQTITASNTQESVRMFKDFIDAKCKVCFKNRNDRCRVQMLENEITYQKFKVNAIIHLPTLKDDAVIDITCNGLSARIMPWNVSLYQVVNNNNVGYVSITG